MVIRTAAGLVFAVVGAGWLAAQAKARKIEANPDPIPYEYLRREPEGRRCSSRARTAPYCVPDRW